MITGFTSGIGLATAKRFAREGARLFLTGRRQKELDDAVAAIGANAHAVSGDVSSEADLDRQHDVVCSETGRIDILFANAGGGSFLPLPDISEEHVDQIFATNVKDTLFTVQKAMPLMAEGGSIVLAGSTVATTGTPAFSVYSASKAAIRSFARHWAIELAPRGIRVNVLVPGATLTPGLRGLVDTEEQRRGLVATLEAGSPMGRMGDPDEIASAALFLASPESSFMTGSELFADGGAAQV